MSKCKLCDSLVTRGGKSLKCYGTTAMVKYLRLKHSKEFELVGKKKVQSFPSIFETSVASTTNTVQSNIIHALNKQKNYGILMTTDLFESIK